jgi:hypothetical protein
MSSNTRKGRQWEHPAMHPSSLVDEDIASKVCSEG